jgi:hypothetical protein
LLAIGIFRCCAFRGSDCDVQIAGGSTNWCRSTIAPADEGDLLIAAKYGCDLNAMLPQHRDQPVDCNSPRLGGSIIGFLVPHRVDVEIRCIGELLLRQSGQYPRRAQVTTIVKTIDLGTGRVAH